MIQQPRNPLAEERRFIRKDGSHHQSPQHEAHPALFGIMPNRDRGLWRYLTLLARTNCSLSEFFPYYQVLTVTAMGSAATAGICPHSLAPTAAAAVTMGSAGGPAVGTAGRRRIGLLPWHAKRRRQPFRIDRPGQWLLRQGCRHGGNMLGR